MKAEFLEARKVWDNMIDQQSAKVEISWEHQDYDKHYICYVLKSKRAGNVRRFVELRNDGSWEVFA
tara:strand:+ start:926 stop:1123 length:198 start_codon:yes stop_codon:yes gene_type:complete